MRAVENCAGGKAQDSSDKVEHHQDSSDKVEQRVRYSRNISSSCQVPDGRVDSQAASNAHHRVQGVVLNLCSDQRQSRTREIQRHKQWLVQGIGSIPEACYCSRKLLRKLESDLWRN